MKRQKRGMGCLGKILIFLFIAAAIIAGGYFGVKYFLDHRAAQTTARSDDILMRTVLIDENRDYTAQTLPSSEYGKDYDGDGLSNGEEIESKTDFYAADTDGDGIGDYDEINTTKSDPLKVSTSGDGISDLVKVVKGLDVNASAKDVDTAGSIDVARDLSFKPEDLNSEVLYVYEEYGGDVFSDMKCLIQPFILYNCEGTVTADIGSSADDSNTAVCYYDTEDRRIAVDGSAVFSDGSVRFKCKSGQPMAVVSTEGLDAELTRKGILSASGESIKEFYLVLVPFSKFDTTQVPDIGIGDYSIKSFVKDNDTLFVLEVSNTTGINKTRSGEVIQDRLKKYSAGWMADYYGIHSIIMNIALNTYHKYAASDDEDTRWTMESIVYRKVRCTLRGLEDEAVRFMEENGYPVSGMEAGSYDSDTGFDVKVNGFRFSNLSTTVSSGGVCAGFAYVCRQAFNNWPMSRESGSYSFMQYNAPGYKTAAAAYNCIFNGEPGTYPANSIVLQAKSDELFDKYDEGYTINAAQMGAPDKSVVDLLNYYWLYDNGERIKAEQHMAKNYNYGFSVIDEINSEFKAGRIVEVGLFGGMGGHAVAAYKLRQDKADPNLFYMYIYDSNFPENKRFAYAGNNRIIRVGTQVLMQLRRHPVVIFSSGSAETVHYYTFRYQVGGGNYRWSNMYGGNDNVSFYKTGSRSHSEFVDGK